MNNLTWGQVREAIGYQCEAQIFASMARETMALAYSPAHYRSVIKFQRMAAETSRRARRILKIDSE